MATVCKVRECLWSGHTFCQGSGQHRSKVEMEPRWNRSGNEVKSNWAWGGNDHRSELDVKMTPKWKRREIEAKPNWKRRTQSLGRWISYRSNTRFHGYPWISIELHPHPPYTHTWTPSSLATTLLMPPWRESNNDASNHSHGNKNNGDNNDNKKAVVRKSMEVFGLGIV